MYNTEHIFDVEIHKRGYNEGLDDFAKSFKRLLTERKVLQDNRPITPADVDKIRRSLKLI